MTIKISDYFYTEGETAKVLGVNRVTIWRWAKEGKLNTQKIGGCKGIVLVSKQEVELLRENYKHYHTNKRSNSNENSLA